MASFPLLRPRNLALGTFFLGSTYYIFGRNANPFRTPGVKQMEERFTAAGGTDTHTPAVATKLGHTNHVGLKQDKPKGVGNKEFSEAQSDQYPLEHGGTLKGKFNESMVGDSKARGQGRT